MRQRIPLTFALLAVAAPAPIAAGKPVLLLALDEQNKRFPFDVQHRHIIRDKNDFARDFTVLGDEITVRLRAV